MNLIDLMDSPQIINMVFYPRRATPHTSRVKGAIDGTIPIQDDIALGYRLYPAPESKAVVLYFHGNGRSPVTMMILHQWHIRLVYRC
jgi:hypothetical protein